MATANCRVRKSSVGPRLARMALRRALPVIAQKAGRKAGRDATRGSTIPLVRLVDPMLVPAISVLSEMAGGPALVPVTSVRPVTNAGLARAASVLTAATAWALHLHRPITFSRNSIDRKS